MNFLTHPRFTQPFVAATLSAALFSSSHAKEPCLCPGHESQLEDSTLELAVDSPECYGCSDATCVSPHTEGVAVIAGDGVLELPKGMPESFQVDLTVAGKAMTLHLEKNSVFGENTRFLVDDGSGSLEEVELGADGSYLGWVVGESHLKISAVLNDNGLYANISRPSEGDIRVEPTGTSAAGAHHQIVVVQLDDAPVVTSEATFGEIRKTDTSEKKAPSKKPITTIMSSRAKANGAASTATLPPSRVMDVREYEIGVEIGSRAFISDTYNSNLATAEASAALIVGNLDRRYLSSTGIKHRLGRVMIRTNAATDPLRDTVTATGAAPNASESLRAFRDYWNANPDEVGSTHDLAVYHVKSSPSGLAYVNSVGTERRYATSGGNGTASWADGTLAHEFGHSWSLGHVDSSKVNYYESKPRNNSGSNSAGGSSVFVSVMHGGGNHNIGRLSTGEANQVYNVRQGKLSFGDVITNPGSIAPFGHRDDVTSQGAAITIDVVENDYDANNDVLDVELLDTVSQQGGAISLSAGTGPGGRDEVIYTPPAGHSGTDFFHYKVCDTSGKSDWAAVYVMNSGPFVVDLTAEDYDYDFGPPTSPVQNNWTAVTPDTNGDISWSGSLSSTDRGSTGGLNNINRDFVNSSEARTFNHKIRNGIWSVTINMGDSGQAHDQMKVTAENGQIVKTNVNSAQSDFVYVSFNVEVTDEELNIEFSDEGGSSPEWVLNRMSLSLVELIVNNDSDDDGLLDSWENEYFGNLTSTSGLPNEDSDNDGLSDLQELNQGTNPTKEDSDDDRLSDIDELNVHLTDPNKADSDGDGFHDRIELLYTTDPNDETSTPVVPELVGYYPFDEGSGSTSANLGSAGSAADAQKEQGTVGWTTSDQRIGGASLTLTGTSSLKAPSVIPSSATAFTISVWVNPDSNGSYRGVYAGRSGPGNWGVNIEGNKADVRFATNGGGSLGVDSPNDSVLVADGWYHILQTWVSDGTQSTGEIYLNGVMVGSTTGARLNFAQPTSGFFIGDDPCCGGREFRGQIDDLAILTRALSSDEVAEVYSEGQKGIGLINAVTPPAVTPPSGSNIGIQNFVAGEASNNVTFSFQTQSDVTYKVYSSADLQTWDLMETVLGDGALYEFEHSEILLLEPRYFYRLEEE